MTTGWFPNDARSAMHTVQRNAMQHNACSAMHYAGHATQRTQRSAMQRTQEKCDKSQQTHHSFAMAGDQKNELQKQKKILTSLLLLKKSRRR